MWSGGSDFCASPLQWQHCSTWSFRWIQKIIIIRTSKPKLVVLEAWCEELCVTENRGQGTVLSIAVFQIKTTTVQYWANAWEITDKLFITNKWREVCWIAVHDIFKCVIMLLLNVIQSIVLLHISTSTYISIPYNSEKRQYLDSSLPSSTPYKTWVNKQPMPCTKAATLYTLPMYHDMSYVLWNTGQLCIILLSYFLLS